MLPDTAASKVTAAHLSRTALLYVRQSSLKQVIHNTESAIRQYDLRGKAVSLGWAADQITVIDIDQGHSGASAADREGFQHLVAEVSLGRAGIVLGLECSRLARNSADWHQLLELCGVTSTLICDEDGLYDPRNFNDRLLLGMKGQLSEAELHFIRARLRGGIISKARRGELITPLPVGLAYDAAGHVTLDPDTAVQGALRRLFTTFKATGSASACVKAFNTDGLAFPWRHRAGPPQGRPGLETAAAPRRPARAAQPPLRRRVHLRPAPRPEAARRQDDHHEAAARGMDRVHPRRPPRIHHHGAVRSQPRQAGRQRRRARP
jgi:DNA invertase Pin-like site-specific DNA recombinase